MTRKKRRHSPRSQSPGPRTLLWMIVLIGLAIMAGLGWGLAISSRSAPAAPVLATSAPAGTNIPDRWITATPIATIPLNFRPEASPETQPVLTLEVAVTDAVTGLSVPARIWVNGVKTAEGMANYDIGMRLLEPGEKRIRVRVEAEGYETWEKDISFNVLYSRRVPLLIELQPLNRPGDDSV